MTVVITIVNVLFQFLTLLVFVHVLLGYFLSPYHPILRATGMVVEPLLKPIRKLIPSMGGLDLSPLVLILLLEVLGSVIVSLLRNLR